MVINILIFMKCMFVVYTEYGGSYIDRLVEDRKKNWHIGGMDGLKRGSRKLGIIMEWLCTTSIE